MKRWQFLVAFACAALLAVPSANAAQAKKPGDDPAAAVAVVDNVVSAAVSSAAAATAVPADATVESSGVQPAAPAIGQSTTASGCWYGFTVQRYGKNIFGSKLWAYFQRLDWCGDGYYIYWHARYRWGEVYFPGWSFEGHIGNNTSGGNGYHSWTAWTQGHFCLAKYFSCVQNAYPWISMTVYGGGGYTWSAGG